MKFLKSIFNQKRIYMDYASATPIDSSVKRAMMPYFDDNYSNPSLLYKEALLAKEAIEKSRQSIANILGISTNEIYFTSGATESNNLTILGVVEAYKGVGLPHVITSTIEHSSILEVCKYLESSGKAEVTYIGVLENGIVDTNTLKEALKENTVLVSIMYANNEIGVIQPINDIAKIIRHFKKQIGRIKDNTSFIHTDESYPYFHTDATQAINYLPINIPKLGVDIMSWNSGKIYGPKGVGGLYKNKNLKIKNIMYGGEQEGGLRPGTESVSNIVGMGVAFKLAEEKKKNEFLRLTKLRDYFFEQLKKNIDDLIINGDKEKRLPNNINISIKNMDSELLVIELDAKGILVSSKSACKSGDGENSYVIMNLGNRNKDDGSIRFSLGRDTIKKDIDYAIQSLKKIIKKNSIWKNK